MRTLLLLLSAAWVLGCSRPASRDVANVTLPEDLEIQLALSALPEQLREGATVYRFVAGTGYQVAAEGSNGFHALVGRDDPAIRFGAWSFDEYPPDILIPVAFDAAGADTHLQTYLDLGRMRATGVPPEVAKETLRSRFQDGTYAAPARAGVAYMLSPVLRAYRSTEVDATIGTFMTPHYMFYAPGVTNADVGGGSALEHPFMLNQTPHPHGVIIQLVGAAERRQIRARHTDMLTRLCGLHTRWCLAEDPVS